MRIIRSIRGGACNKLCRVTICRAGWRQRRQQRRPSPEWVIIVRGNEISLAHRGRRPSFRWFNEVINETFLLCWASEETQGTVTCPLFMVHKSARWFIDDGGSGRWASSSDCSSSYARLIGFIGSSVERLIRSQAHDCRTAWTIINSHGIIARVFVKTTSQRTALISWAYIIRGRTW